MKSFKIRDIEYKKIDFDLYATLEMEEVAAGIFGSLLGTILGNGTTVSLDNFFNSMGKSSKMRECIALIYWEVGEEEFDIETYKKRVETFGKLRKVDKNKAVADVEDFFIGIGDSLMEDFRILSGVIRKKTEDKPDSGNSRGRKMPSKA